ncbi:MAG: PDZ domain-containing protein [Caldithrix sp.]|nr:PDZ domain-containing protein [Caldithrix sp.]
MCYVKRISVLGIVLLIVSQMLAANLQDGRKVLIRKSEGYRLGVLVEQVADDEAKEKNLPGKVRIVSLVEDSEAERIGLQKGDIILAFEGKNITTVEDLLGKVDAISEPKEVQLKIWRDGQEITFNGMLSELPEESEVDVVIDDDIDIEMDLEQLPRLQKHLQKLDVDFMHGMTKGGYLGVKVEAMTEQLLEYFEVEHGVLIEEVMADSPAEKAGLKAGDVITKAADKDIHDYADLVRTLNYYDPDDEIQIIHYRKGDRHQSKVKLGKKEHSMRWFDKHKMRQMMDGVQKEVKVIKENAKETVNKAREIKADMIKRKFMLF